MGEPFAMKVTDFGGMIPRRSETLLPEADAVQAKNCRLLSGALVGLHQLFPTENLNNSPRYSSQNSPQIAYPIGDTPDDYVWLPFENRDVMLAKGPVKNDKYNRYYWTGDGEPKYNTEDRIRAGDSALLLGVPAPTNSVTLAPATSTPQAARAYVYTFVSPYGEEGPPCNPTVDTGGEGTWGVANMDTTVPRILERAPDGTEPGLDDKWHKRIYRTVSGQDATFYYYVADIPLADSTYNDTALSDEVVLNSLLQSEDWEPPPAGLDYLIVHPNGFFVGFVGSDVYMSVPYRPHAWPPEYQLSTEHPVVAMGVFGQSVAAATRSNPYIMSGVEPLAMSFTKINDSTPCLSRYGLVSMDSGVLYPSDRGLMLVTGTDVKNVTEALIIGDQWKRGYHPGDILASARFEDQYLAFYEPGLGFVFTPDEPRAAWSELDQFTLVDSLPVNNLTGRVHVLRAGVLYEWDSPSTPTVLYTWRSKEFEFKKHINLGAARIAVDKAIEVGDEDVLQALLDEFNEERHQFPLASIGLKKFGSARMVTLDSPLPQNHDPAAGSALHTQGLRLGQDYVRMRVWADEALVFDTLVKGEELVMLPQGFKAQRWQFEFQAYQRITNFAVGTSPKALAAA